jgi:hypothetical protein
MYTTPTVTLLLIGVALSYCQNGSKPPEYKDHAIMSTSDNILTISASDPRPLLQAIDALSRYYGLTIDYEDPPYTWHGDLRDMTSPVWRSEHPREPGVMGVAGGEFIAHVSLIRDNKHVVSARSYVEKVVSEYNKSGNPGRFTVYEEGPNAIAVVGTSEKNANGNITDVSPVLDTKVNIPREERSLGDALSAILGQVTQTSGTVVELSSGPAMLLLRSRVKVGGNGVAAITLIRSALDDTGTELHWTCLYEPTLGKYHFNVRPVYSRFK